MGTKPSITFGMITSLLAVLSIQSASSQILDIGTLGGNVCTATNTNNDGAVIGACRNIEGDAMAVYWAPNADVPVALAGLEVNGPCNVFDINNANIAAGNCEQGVRGEYFPVRWTASLPGSSPQRLNPIASHAKADAWVINHAGVVGGSSIEAGGGTRAVLWKAGQVTPTSLPELGLLPPLLPSSTDCAIADMTDDEEPVVVGSCSLRDGGNVAVKWTPQLLGYRANELPRLVGGSNCSAAAVTNDQRVAGTCENATGDVVAVRWSADGKQLTYLDYLEASGNSKQQLSVVDMNEAGIVVGDYMSDDGFSRSFVWAPAGDPAIEVGLDLGTLGGFWTQAVDIADNGAITGVAQNGTGLTEAFVWTPDADMQAMGTLGGFTSSPSALSDDGAWGVGSSQTNTGHIHAFKVSASHFERLPRSVIPQKRQSAYQSGRRADALTNEPYGNTDPFSNERIMRGYIACVDGKGKCSPQGQELRKLLGDAPGFAKASGKQQKNATAFLAYRKANNL